MNFFLTAVCLVVCVYVAYQSYRAKTIANKQLFEVKKTYQELQIFILENQAFVKKISVEMKALTTSMAGISDQFDQFVSENEVSFGSVEREIESAKNELILLIKKDEIQQSIPKKQSSQLKSLSQAFAAKSPTIKDDE